MNRSELRLNSHIYIDICYSVLAREMHLQDHGNRIEGNEIIHLLKMFNGIEIAFPLIDFHSLQLLIAKMILYSSVLFCVCVFVFLHFDFFYIYVLEP